MSDLIVDSSVAIKWYVNEADSPVARRILDDFDQGLLQLIAPDLLLVELANIVWKKQWRQGLDPNLAATICADLGQMRCAIVPSASLLNDAFALAVRNQRTVYDMLYVALALRLNCPMVTADERLANSLANAVPLVKKLADWP